MNDSMTTDTGSRVTKTGQPSGLECPSWCQDDESGHDEWHAVACVDHDDYYGPGLVRDHHGPRFGPFLVGAQTEAVTGSVTFWVMSDEQAVRDVGDIDGPGTSPSDGLRKIAADALAAAEWLEGQL